MTRWYQTLGASLRSLGLTRSMAATGWDDHIRSEDSPNGSDKSRATLDPAVVLNRLCEIEQDLEARQADIAEAAEKVACLKRDIELRGLPFPVELWGSGPPVGRWFDTDSTTNADPAWLSYLAGEANKTSSNREEER